MLKVTEPERVVTDELVLRELLRQGVDKNFVEFYKDYSDKTPNTKFYRDLKNKRTIAVISMAPKVTGTGQVVPKWYRLGVKYKAGNNTFSATVTNKFVDVTCRGKNAIWSPQVFLKLPDLNAREILPQSPNPTLLPVDPVNNHYQRNTLEWDYGICKRRLRIIEGQLIERYVFESDPGGDITIKSNWAGDIKAAKNWGKDAAGNYLKVKTSGDTEVIAAEEFEESQLYKTYPRILPTDEGLGRKGKCTGCGLCGTWDFVAGRNQGKSLDVIKRLVDKWMDKILDGEIRFAVNKQIPVECGYNLTKDGEPVQYIVSGLKYPIIIASSPETFYPAVDGDAFHLESNGTWASVRDGVGNGYRDVNTTLYVWLQSGTVANKWAYINRGLLSFLTSPIPEHATITDAILTLWGLEKQQQFDPPDPEVNIYGTSLASPTAIEAGDYDGVSSTPFSSNITFDDFDIHPTTPLPNDFVFNQDGKDWINTDGYTELSIREAIYDVADSPPTWLNAKRNYFSIVTTEYGSPYIPKLIITFATPKMCSSGLAAVSAMEASLSTQNKLSGSLSGSSEMAGALATENKLSGSMSVVSKMTGNLSNEKCDGSGI